MSVFATSAGHVSLVDIVQASGQTDVAGFLQGCHGCPGAIGQLEGGVELGDVPGGVGSQMCHDERGNTLQILVGIIESRNDEGGKFNPDSLLTVFNN